MDTTLHQIKNKIYNNCALEISDFKTEQESTAYDACKFVLNGHYIRSRNAKITPKKTGQFVTFWKRYKNGPIEPFNETDPIDFYVVNVRTKNALGQFVFPKSILITKRIISTEHKEGKRAFRVYPSWDIITNKQAKRTQKWHLVFFYEINDSTNLNKVLELHKDN
ncbi:MepB family protein [Maribacter sp. ACAM166]|uniref:MepB family protein n=1 Tax=Maribacter sp. ACAM166 TaxID=2508996 RepID=UPI0010FD987F|nr:MepB family protein [Maribacter sp. ACAM166]TLP81327.1 MepB family protein [Maribacter sp. ACAM166]